MHYAGHVFRGYPLADYPQFRYLTAQLLLVKDADKPDTHTMKYWFLLLVAIVCEVVATTALKSSNGFTRLLPTAVVITGYGASFYFLALTLKAIPVGIAYAVWSGLGIVLITILAWLFHGQKLDLWGFVGLSLIVGGVLVLNQFSKVQVH